VISYIDNLISEAMSREFFLDLFKRDRLLEVQVTLAWHEVS
jgi:hypothetical protein